MPNLGDFLGHLMSEVTIARVHADVESIRIAELYASHPLLVNLPVPHFRLPNIEIDVPVVVKTMEEEQPGQPARGAPSLKEMRNKFSDVLSKYIKDESVKINPEQRKKLDNLVEKKITEFVKPNEVAVNINQVADGLASLAASAISGEDSSKQEKIKGVIKNTLRVEFLNLSKPPARLKVLVATSEIREAGPSEIITRLHLKLNEESFEWTATEASDGTKRDKLVPE